MPQTISMPLHTSQTYCALILTLMSSRAFADRIGVSTATVSTYVSGKCAIALYREKTLQRILLTEIAYIKKCAATLGHTKLVQAQMVEREMRRRFPALFANVTKRSDIKVILREMLDSYGGEFTRLQVIQTLAQDDDATDHPQIRTAERVADEIGIKRKGGKWFK